MHRTIDSRFPDGVTPQIWFADEVDHSKYGLTKPPESKRARISDPACLERVVEGEDDERDWHDEEVAWQEWPQRTSDAWYEAQQAADLRPQSKSHGAASSRQYESKSHGGGGSRQYGSKSHGDGGSGQYDDDRWSNRSESSRGRASGSGRSCRSLSDASCMSNVTGPMSVGERSDDEEASKERLTSNDRIIIIVGIVTIIIIVSSLLLLSAAS